MTSEENPPLDNMHVYLRQNNSAKVASAYAVSESGKIGSTLPDFEEGELGFTVRHPDNLGNDIKEQS
jgi:hypothetical protein